MLRFLFNIALLSGIILALAIIVHWGWKGAVLWDRFVGRRIKHPGLPFEWRSRYTEGIGLRFEYLFFAVLRKQSYFRSNWWMLRSSALLAVPLFLTIIFMNERVEDYYASIVNGEAAWALYLKGGFAFWILNVVHLLYLTLFVALIIESVRMHKWAALIRVVFCSILIAGAGVLSLLSMAMIIMTGFFFLIFMWIRNLIFGPTLAVDHSHYVIRSWNPVVNDFRQFAFDLYYQEEFHQPQESTVIEKIQHTEQTIRPQRDESLPQFHPD